MSSTPNESPPAGRRCATIHPSNPAIECAKQLGLHTRKHLGWHRDEAGGVSWPQAKEQPSKAALIEHLVPTLDSLCADLIQMDLETGIELSAWPAAQRFVDLWNADHPTPL